MGATDRGLAHLVLCARRPVWTAAYGPPAGADASRVLRPGARLPRPRPAPVGAGSPDIR